MARRGVAEQTRLYRGRAEELATSLLAELALPEPRGRARRALVVLIGLPGAGKSHFGRLLVERLGAPLVSTDGIRRRLFVAPSYAREETRTVFAVAQAMARRLLGLGRTTIFDATNLRERDRRPLYALADEAGAAAVLVHLVAPEPAIYGRLAGRRERSSREDASEADERVYEMMRGRYEEPSRPYLVVDTAEELAPAVTRVIKALERA